MCCAPVITSGDPEVSWRFADVAEAEGDATGADTLMQTARPGFERFWQGTCWLLPIMAPSSIWPMARSGASLRARPSEPCQPSHASCVRTGASSACRRRASRRGGPRRGRKSALGKRRDLSVFAVGDARRPGGNGPQRASERCVNHAGLRSKQMLGRRTLSDHMWRRHRGARRGESAAARGERSVTNAAAGILAATGTNGRSSRGSANRGMGCALRLRRSGLQPSVDQCQSVMADRLALAWTVFARARRRA